MLVSDRETGLLVLSQISELTQRLEIVRAKVASALEISETV
jgi:hypothetical protein